MKDKEYIKVWGEHISLKELFMGLLISLVLIVGMLLIEKFLVKKAELRLVFGLAGIIIAFIINTILFKPKRNLIVKQGDHNDH